jgi:GDP-L-fucose synthase
MIAAMDELEGGEVVNLSDTESTTMSQLAETVLSVADHDAEIVYDESKPEGVKVRKPDTERATSRLDWEPQVGLREGIGRTYDWYVQHGSVDE